MFPASKLLVHAKSISNYDAILPRSVRYAKDWYEAGARRSKLFILLAGHLSAAPRSARAPLARWTRGTAAVLMTLAAPALSTSDALTTGLNGTSPAVGFPPGCGIALAATVAATALAAALAALIAGARRPGGYPGLTQHLGRHRSQRRCRRPPAPPRRPDRLGHHPDRCIGHRHSRRNAPGRPPPAARIGAGGVGRA
jgi:hypothetical protein